MVNSNSSGIGKLILGIGAAVGVGLVGYGVYSGIASYAQGKSCSANPGSPCYPYTQAYQTCLNQYVTANQQFLQEDQAAGTGYTQEQLTYLSNLQTCMNNASSNIYKASQAMNLPITQAIEAITAATIIVLTARGLISAYTKLKLSNAQRVSGNDTAASVRQATFSDAIEKGNISPETASNLSESNSSMTQTDTTATQDFASQTATELDLTEEEIVAIDAATEESIATVADASDAIDAELVDISAL